MSFSRQFSSSLKCVCAFKHELCVFHDSRTLGARKTTVLAPCLEGVKISQVQPFAFRLFSRYFPSRAVPVTLANGSRGFCGPFLAVACFQRIRSLAFLLQIIGSNFPRLASGKSLGTARPADRFDSHASDDVIIISLRSAHRADLYSVRACSNLLWMVA
jgi:hypothetical protein